jgi:F-type H+-transporting ATPase subunit b
MDSTLQALSGLLLTALPTFFLVVFLHFYLKSMFFGPMAKVLKDRHDATEGAKRSAEKSLAAAEEKAAACEAAIRHARGEIYREKEKLLRDLQEQKAVAVREAMRAVEALVKDSKAEIAREAASAGQALEGEAAAVADQIVESILGRRAA